jgi:AbrB family looped-hinge helix DNA binding protein
MDKIIDLDRDFFGAVTVNERGQMVIPAEARKTLDITSGEKLLLFYHRGMHCLVLTKLDHFSAMVEHFKNMAALVEQDAALKEGEEDA